MGVAGGAGACRAGGRRGHGTGWRDGGDWSGRSRWASGTSGELSWGMVGGDCLFGGECGEFWRFELRGARGEHWEGAGFSPTFWAVLSQAGAPGAAGAAGATGPQGPAGAVGVTYRGTWTASTAYHANDVVGFGGATYLAAATSLGSEPDVSPSLWAVLALNGSTGATGPAGAAATVNVGTVTTGAAGSQASVTNVGRRCGGAELYDSAGRGGSDGTGGGGGGGGTSGIPFASVFHSVSFNLLFHSVNSSTDAATETDSVLTWVPAGCTATQLSVFSHQTNTVNVILRQGTPGNMANTSLVCSVAPGGSCTETGSVVVPAGNFVDFTVTGASGTA